MTEDMQAAMRPETQNDVVMVLGTRARRLSWGYALFAVYYCAMAVLVAHKGIRFSGIGQFANDVIRLTGVLLPLAAYIVVNAATAASLRHFLGVHVAVRWCTVVAAVLLAGVALGTFGYSIWRWLDLERPGGFAVHQLLGLGFIAGYVILAACVIKVTHRLQHYVLIDEMWLLKRLA